jgi:hypothetical protein
MWKNGRICAVLAAALWLGACANPFFVFAPDAAEVIQSAWYPPAELPAPRQPYCYRTLGRVDCYRAPMPDQASRLVGSFDDTPAD